MTAGMLDRVASLADVLALMNDCLDAATRLDLSAVEQAELLDALREQEIVRNRLAAMEHALVAETADRGLAYELGHRNTTELLRAMLRLTPTEARARATAAENCGPRRTLSGEPLTPLFPHVAAAHSAGAISPRHASVITRAIDALPDVVQAEHADLLEQAFVAEAHELDPVRLAHRARIVIDHLDPDGKYSDTAYRNKKRDLSVGRRDDGSAHLEAEMTAELAEMLDVVLDSLGGPKPAADGTRDPRTPGQRRHDALLDALRLLTRTGRLPEAGGCPATLVLTMTTDQFLTGTGYATTGHHRLIPADQAIATAGGDARVLGVVMNDLHEITHCSGTHRFFTTHQRLVMSARDRGCTAPGCDAPPGWCEAHHVTDYEITGRTSVDDGGLACGYHHREYINQGWTTTMIDGRPHWIPPAYLDPHQTPQRNTMFDDPITDPSLFGSDA